ncbi:transposase [Halococcus thailandensis]|nr:transposase [Halococcus thailandensis]
MAATSSSKRAVFQAIADTDEKYWPYYRCPSEEYTADDPDALKHDISTLAREWFRHDAHEDVETFICTCPLAYFEFSSYDTYPDWHAQTKPAVPLLRALMLMHLHGWEHETPLVTYLGEREGLADALGFESVPSQATLWRACHERFSRDLLRAVKQCADFVRIHASWNRIDVPDTIDTAGSDSTSQRGPSVDSEGPSQKEVLSRAGELTDQAKRLLFPAFAFDRENGRIHENAFWELQTYTGLRDGMCVNEGARSFLVDSTRDRTPLGHIHRQYLRELSIGEIREMYGRAIRRLLDEAEQTAAFHQAVTVAIDITTDTPFTGNRDGHETKIIGTKEKNDEYAYHWATIQIVGEDLPLILDARPVRKGESRTEIVMELLDSDLAEKDDPQEELERFFWCYVEFAEENSFIQQTVIQGDYQETFRNMSPSKFEDVQRKSMEKLLPLIEDLRERSVGPLSDIEPFVLLSLMGGSIGLLAMHKEEFVRYEEEFGYEKGYYQRLQDILVSSLARGLTVEK